MKPFNSKFNIGQNVAEGIYQDLTEAFNNAESGSFDKAFGKFKTIKGKIPIKKIDPTSIKKFKALDALYFNANKDRKSKLKYKIAMKYSEILVDELDKNNMYLPSLKDMSTFA
jgi:hypothetical protein